MLTGEIPQVIEANIFFFLLQAAVVNSVPSGRDVQVDFPWGHESLGGQLRAVDGHFVQEEELSAPRPLT